MVVMGFWRGWRVGGEEVEEVMACAVLVMVMAMAMA